MPRSNIEHLKAIAELLHPMLPELVFVGGAVTELLVTDAGVGSPRPTLDIDAITAVDTYAQYASFGERLRALGFTEDAREGAPVCRWIHGNFVLDVMPLDEAVLGFSNHWYKAAMRDAMDCDLSDRLRIRLVTAPHFLATKIEAFHGRGQDDLALSHDLEDLIYVIDGRPSIVDEVRSQDAALNEYLRAQFGNLLKTRTFIDALPGFLLPDGASQARLPLVLERMRALAAPA